MQPFNSQCAFQSELHRPDPLIHDRVVVEADGELLPLVRGQTLLRVAHEAEARVVHLAPAPRRRDRRRAYGALAGCVV